MKLIKWLNKWLKWILYIDRVGEEEKNINEIITVIAVQPIIRIGHGQLSLYECKMFNKHTRKKTVALRPHTC